MNHLPSYYSQALSEPCERRLSPLNAKIEHAQAWPANTIVGASLEPQFQHQGLPGVTRNLEGRLDYR